MRKSLLSLVFGLLLVNFAFAQSILTGTVYSADYVPLNGAEVSVLGSTINTSTNSEGYFTLEVPAGEGNIEIASEESSTLQMPYNVEDGQTFDFGVINLMPGDGVSLSSIVVVGKGLIDLEEDRKTPVAVSTILREEIQEKAVGNVEFPEVMKNTPNVYVTNQAGGFGDGQMFLRGFDQSNTAFLLNGQPINGMEDGKMYWSNWSGLADVANAIQVQRGLGSSKLAISSVGGTINIITKATDKRQGGFARFLVGNDSYFKGTLSYNTGLMSNGWGVSVMVDHWQAHRKYAEGTAGQGQNYFFSVGKQMGLHNFNFLLVGSPQWHDKNSAKSADKYRKYGLKYNDNLGFEDGHAKSFVRNYYHKPVLNFNWDYDMSPNASLSTVLYASFGRGGQTGRYGSSRNSTDILDNNGHINFNQIYANNALISDGVGTYGSAAALRASVNNHQWYGGVTNFNYDMDNGLSFNLGADLRFYKGDHFRQLIDLFGLESWDDAYGRYGEPSNYLVSSTFEANPWSALTDYADEEERIGYDNSEEINYKGGFGQIEYANDRFSVFAQGALSTQSYQKEDRFAKGGEKSPKVDKTGYNIKGGGAFYLNENNTIFANAGKYSRQPFLDNIYERYTIKLIEPEIDNEEITGYELGYRFTKRNFTVNLNAYRTSWGNRFIAISDRTQGTDASGNPITINTVTNFTSVDQLHKGLELEVRQKLNSKFQYRAYMAYGDWKYEGETDATVYDSDTNEKITSYNDVKLEGTKIGETPHFSSGLGISFEALKGLSIDVDTNFYGKLYSSVDVSKVVSTSLDNLTNDTDKVYQPERINDYAIVDLGLTYEFDFLGKGLKFRGNVYNLFDNEYISRQYGSGDRARVYYGNGTTYNASLMYKF